MPTRPLTATALLVGVLLSAPAVAYAQPAPTASVTQLERDFLKNLLRDQKAIWTSPAHIRANDIWWIGAVAGATTAFIATDLETGDFIAKYPDLLAPSHALEQAGHWYTVGATAATVYLIGKFAKKDRLMETGLLAGQALIGSQIFTGVVKGIAQRARPDSGEERSQFFVGGNSFTSGHASNVWSFAAVVANEYRDNRYVQVIAYSAAGLISISRFTAQRHYLSDILVGSAIGFTIGQYVYRTHHIESGKTGGTGKWPLVSTRVDRAAKGYSIGLTWVY